MKNRIWCTFYDKKNVNAMQHNGWKIGDAAFDANGSVIVDIIEIIVDEAWTFLFPFWITKVSVLALTWL